MPRKKSSSSLKEDLFGDVPDGVSAPSLTINKGFARSFEERKTRQELGRAREFGITANGAAGGEESMSEDDTGEALDAAMDARISATIDAIRRRDPRVYVPDARFFEGEKKTSSDSDSDDDGDGDNNAQVTAAAAATLTTTAFKATTKTKTARDTLRQQLLSAAEEGKTDAFGDDDEDESLARAADAARAANPRAYDEEQRTLRRAFLDIKAEDKEEGDGDSDDDGSGLLRVKPRDEASEAAAIAEAIRDREVLRAAMKTKGGKTALHGDQVADPDAFLATFLKSNAWRVIERDNDHDDEDVGSGGVGINVAVKTTTIPDSEDEEEVWKAEDFEAGYNFRFEEKGGGAIVTHARGAAAAAGSLRRKDTGRADERGRKAERSAEIKAAADADARRLMNLKRAEHKNRITRIHETAGAGVDMAGLAAALGTDALDGDFDPEAHDAAMAALFGDDYYGVEEMEGGGGKEDLPTTASTKTKKKSSKPAPWVWGDGPRPAWAGPSAEELAEGVDDGLGDVIGRDIEGDIHEEEDEEEGEAGNDGGYGDNGEEENGAVLGSRALKRARKLGRRAKGASRRMGAVARARASIAAEDAARARMLPSVGGGGGGGGGGRIDDLDEVLALGFEDVIAGGLRTRFHYTTVPADSFGLSADEILGADDSELNGYVGLRRLAPFRETPWHVPPYLAKQGVGAIQRAIAARREASGEDKANVIGGTKHDFSSGENNGEGERDKKKKRRKDKSAAAAVEEEEGEQEVVAPVAENEDIIEEEDADDTRRAAKKAKKKARKAAAAAGMDEAEIQRISRLKSYGLK
jgi:protein KRI1